MPIKSENLISEFNSTMGTSVASLNSVPGMGTVTPAAHVSGNGGSSNIAIGSGDVFDTSGVKKKKRKKRKRFVEDENDITREQILLGKQKQSGIFKEHLLSYDEFSNEYLNI